jgi:arylamine N-acetyltransferase
MNQSSIPTDEILEALDLSRAEPGLGFLRAVFNRFNARVPFETASKILRHSEFSDPDAKPRRPELFWREHLELGTGGTCFARVAAFDALLRSLGFATGKVLGRVEQDGDHAALVVDEESGIAICDVGFPLPAILPGRDGRIETAILDLEVSRTERGFRIEFDAGVPEGPRELEIFDARVSDGEFDARWRATFNPRSRFLSEVLLRRQEESRVVSYARGEVRVDDRHSRLTVPIGPPRAARLASLFEIDTGLLQKAMDLAGEPEPGAGPSRLTAYLETPASAESAFAAVSSVAAYRRLLDGVARVVGEEKTDEGWRLALAPPGEGEPTGSAVLREDVATNPARLALRVRRRTGESVVESELRAERRSGKTYLIREAFFDTPREDLLRNDSLRGRFAGALAIDLLAWARLIR